MKNFRFLALFLLGIATIQPIRTEEPLNLAKNQTLITYIYSCLWKQQQEPEIMPSPKESQDKVILLDLDGVLFTTDKMKAFQKIGMTTVAQYIATELFVNFRFKLPSHNDVFDALETTPADSTFAAYNQGMRMPAIMVDWQCATQSLIAIQLAMNRHIKNSDKSESEKNLLLNTISMMTTPEKFIATRQVIPAGVALLHELKEKGYKIYVLSNWDPTSFPLLVAKYPEIFKHQDSEMFDGIMISGNVGMLKPDAALFEKCLTDFNVQACNAIFIDDTIENVIAAQNMGITTIHCDPANITATRKQLIQHLKN